VSSVRCFMETPDLEELAGSDTPARAEPIDDRLQLAERVTGYRHPMAVAGVEPRLSGIAPVPAGGQSQAAMFER
jgi:hypothetical protein